MLSELRLFEVPPLARTPDSRFCESHDNGEGGWLPLDQFEWCRGIDTALRNICKRCRYEQSRVLRGVDRMSLYYAQGGRCPICLKHDTELPGSQRLVPDHDWQTGRIGGLLCSSHCNVGLGHFKRDPERLMRAVLYVEGTA